MQVFLLGSLGFWAFGYYALRRYAISFFIDKGLEEIAAACQRYGIERLFLFG